jgi:hypothetical protein
LAALIPWNRFLGFLKVPKFGLSTHSFLPDCFSSLLCLRIFGYGVVFAQEDS